MSWLESWATITRIFTSPSIPRKWIKQERFELDPNFKLVQLDLKLL